MLVVIDKPLIQYAVEEAMSAGIERFIFITADGKEAIKNHFEYNPTLDHFLKNCGKEDVAKNLDALCLDPGNIIFIQQHAPLGLGHAVLCAQHLIPEEAFALILADDLILSTTPCLKQMIDAYDGGNMAAVMKVAKDEVGRYGILTIDPHFHNSFNTVQTNQTQPKQIRALNVWEKPPIDKAPSTTAIIGRYILSSSIFNHLKTQQKGAGGEIQLTDSIQKMIEKGVELKGLYFEGQRFDCGTKEGLLEANITFAMKNPGLRPYLNRILMKLI